MSLPTVCQDARFYDLLDYERRLQKSRVRWLDKCKAGMRVSLTPNVPSRFISLALFTKPYAPLPISPSITNSEMLRSPTLGVRSTPGVGGPVLLATLRKLAALLARTNFIGAVGGGEGGCEGTIETRPAIRDTR